MPIRTTTLRDVDQELRSVGDVLIESRLEFQARRREEPVLVQVVGTAVNDEQRSARGTNAPRAGTSSSTQSARLASATSACVPIIVATPDSRAETTRGAFGSPGGGAPASGWRRSTTPHVVAVEFDQRRRAATDRCGGRRSPGAAMLASARRYAVATAIAGTCPVPSPRSKSRGSSSTAWTKVATKSPTASWLGLSRRSAARSGARTAPSPAGHDDRDCQHERREAHHRDRDRGPRVRRCRPTDEGLQDRLVVEGSVKGDRARRSPARDDTHDRHEPKARCHAYRELSRAHRQSYPTSPRHKHWVTAVPQRPSLPSRWFA